MNRENMKEKKTKTKIKLIKTNFIFVFVEKIKKINNENLQQLIVQRNFGLYK